ncbi:MAG: type II toxin-antitoxin system HicB family antitoxin [Spirosoma sp.]|nr:type II toxin-antitoxin system HicB family antitoxin [Spirosoma sp.]
MTIRIETEQETDGRWIADAPDLSGVMAYGQTKEQAVRFAEALALRVIAERLEYGEPVPEVTGQLFEVAV